MATKAEKAAAKAAKLEAARVKAQAAKDAKAAKVQAAKDVKAAKSAAAKIPKPPVLTKAQVKAAAIDAKFAELKTQDAAGHKVTPAQLDELQALVNG